MSLKITHKNSTAAGTPPASGDIDVGEIAINAADAALYVKDTNGDVKNVVTDALFTQVGSGAVQRTVESKLQDVVSVKDFGAVGDGVTDDTPALASFFAAIAGTNKPIGDLGDDAVYLFSSLNIPSGLKLRGRSVLRCNGTTATGLANVILNGSIEAEGLNFATAGTETNGDFLWLNSTDYKIGSLTVISDIERVGTGGVSYVGAGNVKIDYFKTANIARPWAATTANPATDVPAQNVHLGSVEIDNYIRGIKFENVAHWSVSKAVVKGKDSRALYTPGHNGILIGQCTDWYLGNITIQDSGEHGMRIGGNSSATRITERGCVDFILTRNTGATGVKLNSAQTSASFGIRNVTFGEIVAIDCGQAGVANVGNPEGNQDGLRITDAQDIYVGSFVNLAINSTYSSSHSINLNSNKNVVIDSVYSANTFGNMIRIDKDIDETARNFDGLYINSFRGISSNSSVIAIEYQDGARTIGNIYVNDINVGGSTGILLSTTEPIIQAGVIRVQGTLRDQTANFSLNTGATVHCDLWSGAKRFFGTTTGGIGFSADDYRSNVSTFSNAASVGNKASHYIEASSATSGLNNYAGSLGFSRAGSSRRGAAIVAKQTGSSSTNVGLSFFTSGSTSVGSSDAVSEYMQLKHTGTFWLGSVGTYATNADAIADGKVAGDVYKSSTGELKIVI